MEDIIKEKARQSSRIRQFGSNRTALIPLWVTRISRLREVVISLKPGSQTDVPNNFKLHKKDFQSQMTVSLFFSTHKGRSGVTDYQTVRDCSAARLPFFQLLCTLTQSQTRRSWQASRLLAVQPREQRRGRKITLAWNSQQKQNGGSK